MKSLFALLALLFQAVFVFAQSIGTKPKSTQGDIYMSVTCLQQSPMYYSDIDKCDYAFRFIVVTQEIYDYVYVEKVVFGEEGGGKQIEWRKRLDMDIFYELGVKGEISGVKFGGWMVKGSFEMKIHDLEFEVVHLNSPEWIVQRKP